MKFFLNEIGKFQYRVIPVVCQLGWVDLDFGVPLTYLSTAAWTCSTVQRSVALTSALPLPLNGKLLLM